MKVGDLIRVQQYGAGGAVAKIYKINGQLGVLIGESLYGASLYKQWRVLVGGDIYWLYPGELEVIDESG
jgi:hypothetical protein|tara:strand:+ start:5480 stop:5686 length:207 start_codon:yes stop_codon:yes gene_type:complete